MFINIEDTMVESGLNVCRMCLAKDKDNNFVSLLGGKGVEQFESIFAISVSFFFLFANLMMPLTQLIVFQLADDKQHNNPTLLCQPCMITLKGVQSIKRFIHKASEHYFEQYKIMQQHERGAQQAAEEEVEPVAEEECQQPAAEVEPVAEAVIQADQIIEEEKKVEVAEEVPGSGKAKVKARSYECDQCEKRFTAKKSLRSHMITHSGKISLTASKNKV